MLTPLQVRNENRVREELKRWRIRRRRAIDRVKQLERKLQRYAKLAEQPKNQFSAATP